MKHAHLALAAVFAALGAGCSVHLAAHSSASVVARDLDVIQRGTCAVEPLVREVGPECRRVVGDVAAGPDLDPAIARAAVDDDTCRTFHAGAAPRWIALDFKRTRDVTAVLLLPRSDGQATHVLEASDDGVTWNGVLVFTGPLSSEQGYALVLPEPVSTRWLRVSTTSATAPVAWRDIVPLDCG